MALHSIPIPEFMSGKNVFITGATGFLGKALIEKLLRSCPQIGTIYILMRPKRGKGLPERLLDLTNDMLYERLKSEQLELKVSEKIVPVAGDMNQLRLGLSDADRQQLIDHVNIVYHVAASVRFDDALSDAIIMNVRGTREVCQLSLDMKHLVAHVHVSTAFANCDRKSADEVLYPAKVDWRAAIEIAEKFDKHTLEILMVKYIDTMPNTYCFTKQIAEHVVYDMCKGKVPALILRPSIVISTLKAEPVKGWIDNFNGPVGILVAYGKGILRTIYANKNYKPDYIPVDISIKAIIVASWDLGLRGNVAEVEVIHCTSYNAQWLRPPIEKLAKVTHELAEKLPFDNVLWTISKHTTSNLLLCYIRTILFMVIPAFFIDAILKMMGKKPMLLKLQRKIMIAQLALRHFLMNEWSYSNYNLLKLQKTIMPKDMEDWDYEFMDGDFMQYMEDAVRGCRKYLLREPDSTLPAAKRHYRRMLWAHFLVKLILTVLFAWTIWRMDFVQTHFHQITNQLQPFVNNK